METTQKYLNADDDVEIYGVHFGDDIAKHEDDEDKHGEIYLTPQIDALKKTMPSFLRNSTLTTGITRMKMVTTNDSVQSFINDNCYLFADIRQ